MEESEYEVQDREDDRMERKILSIPVPPPPTGLPSAGKNKKKKEKRRKQNLSRKLSEVSSISMSSTQSLPDVPALPSNLQGDIRKFQLSGIFPTVYCFIPSIFILNHALFVSVIL